MEAMIVVHEGSSLRRHVFGEWAASSWLGLCSLAYAVLSVWAWQGGSIFFGAVLSTACGVTYLAHRWFLRSYRAARDLLRSLPDLPAARLLPLPRH